jgi:AcrR family transcriptional regulator
MSGGLTSTQQRIVAAAMRCFQRGGGQAATVGDIAEEAQVARKTVYRLFDDRQTLIVTILRQQFFEVLEALREQLPRYASFAEALVEGHLFAIRQLEADPTFLQLVASETSRGVNPILMSDPEVRARVHEVWLPHFLRARAAAVIRSPLPNERLIDGGARLAALLTLSTDVGEEGRRHFLRDFYVPALLGLSGEEGRE